METKWLPCSVSPGQFPTEYAISGTQYNGEIFSLFAPQEVVRPANQDTAEGSLQVQVVDRKGEFALVRLPAPTFENGQYVTVQAALLLPTPQLTRPGA